MLNKLSNRERNLLTIMALVIAIYMFDLFFFSPILRELKIAREKRQELRLDLQVAEKKIRILEILQDKSGVIRPDTPSSTQRRALQTLQSISQVTTRSKLNLITVRPIQSQEQGRLKFSLTCSGKYRNLYDFMVYLNDLPIIVIIDILDCFSNGAKDPTLDITMTLIAYY
ncbi:MAG: type II secretion system protein M [Candidatus Margulisbacteria bacterium]|nr:type II secretion system protein M [Candidatus Margulisiibacteriota bacterium]MBU1617571.1 type II secretion system protein M [Candidatus Margulisiibacteriota bacterium]